jgi:hypothetical protein
MACYDGFIGVRNCGLESKIYLDDYGLSLFDLAKISDEKTNNGAKLLESFIKIAWEKVYSDVHINGYNFNKILSDISLTTYLNGSTTLVGGIHDVNFTLGKCCKIVSFYVSSIFVNIKTDGQIKIDLIEGSNTTTLFDGVTNGSFELNLNRFVANEFILRVDLTAVGSATVYASNYENDTCSCSCQFYKIDNYGNGLDVDLQVRCDKSKHLCKFTDILAPAVIASILGQFWFKVHTTNRANEHKIFKDVDAISMMAYYNSDYLAMVQSDGKGVTKEGQYQMEISKINIPLPKCNCCLECEDSIVYEISIP